MVDLRDAILVFLANSKVALEEEADMTTTGTYINQSKYHITVHYDIMEDLASALGIKVKLYEDPWMAIEHAIRAENDAEDEAVEAVHAEDNIAISAARVAGVLRWRMKG